MSSLRSGTKARARKLQRLRDKKKNPPRRKRLRPKRLRPKPKASELEGEESKESGETPLYKEELSRLREMLPYLSEEVALDLLKRNHGDVSAAAAVLLNFSEDEESTDEESDESKKELSEKPLYEEELSRLLEMLPYLSEESYKSDEELYESDEELGGVGGEAKTPEAERVQMERRLIKATVGELVTSILATIGKKPKVLNRDEDPERVLRSVINAREALEEAIERKDYAAEAKSQERTEWGRFRDNPTKALAERIEYVHLKVKEARAKGIDEALIRDFIRANALYLKKQLKEANDAPQRKHDIKLMRSISSGNDSQSGPPPLLRSKSLKHWKRRQKKGDPRAKRFLK